MSASSLVPIPVNTPAAVQFTHEGELIWVGLQVVTVALALALLASGLGVRLRSALERMSGGRRWLTLTLFAWAYLILQTLLALPLRYYDEVVRWARWTAQGVPAQPLQTWLAGQAASLLVVMVAAAALLWIPFRLIERRPRTWPLLLTALVLPALAAVLVTWQVVLLPATTRFAPLADKTLAVEIQTMARRCGAGTVPVLVGGNDNTVVGLGPTSRILIAPWALKLQTRPQLLTSVAHELKHYRMGDNWLAIAVVGVLMLAGFIAVQLAGGLALRLWGDRLGFSALHDPAALPLMVLILVLCWSLAGLPILNAVQRRVEHEADRFALEVTHQNRAFAEWQATVQPWRMTEEDWFTRTFMDNHPEQAERVRFGNDYRPWADGRPGVYDRVCKPPS
jgi:STE24 endopeptidase